MGHRDQARDLHGHDRYRGRVAKRYNVSRAVQDEYALHSQLRTAAGWQVQRRDHPGDGQMAVVDRETKEVSYREVTVNRDECNRPDTTLEGLASSNQYRRVASLLLATPASCRMVPPPSW